MSSGGGGQIPPLQGLPPRRGGGGWWWALGIFLVVVGLVAAGGLYLVGQLGDLGSSSLGLQSGTAHDELREVVIQTSSTRDKIAVVDMQGVISSDPMDYHGNSIVSHIEEQLERAGEDTQVRAVLLKIDSPGGEVLASDEIYKLLAEFQEEYDKPVVASMGTVAASGGYYVAAPCRWIVANELTITGSIGVIMQTYNWRALMDKVGVRPQVFKSGAFKDMLSPDKQEIDITSEERRMVQDLVNETFERFKAVIEEGRGLAHARNEDNLGETTDQGRQLAANWKDFADGRLLSGKEAWRLGFVDELGDFSAAVDRARKLAGIEDAKLIQYLRPASFGSLFRLLGNSQDTRIQVDLGVRVPKLRTGLYFLAPHLAP
jgi:protease IV